MLKSTPKKASTYTHQYPTDPVIFPKSFFRVPSGAVVVIRSFIRWFVGRFAWFWLRTFDDALGWLS